MQEKNTNKREERSDFGVEENNDFNQYGYAYPKKSLTKGQKLAVGVLAFFAFLLITFQFVNFKKSINEPFEYKENNNTASKDSTCSGSDCPENIANLRAQDTDGDGINDYDELHIYKTSPYLEDSDSDGFSDSEEINNGKDPNCPSGRDCHNNDPLANVTAEDKSSLDIGNLQEAFNQKEQGVSSSSSETSASDFNPQDLENIDADSLRSLLLESGVEKKVLDQISDEDLLSTFQDVLKSK